ncbi:MAG: MBL fold metallo-hydrolase [Candidatus Sericytochromatia bacterium]|nr:MBL fold metallo-hydrolase [Candidatus Tanganyikabacteria bacterium]
MKRTFHLTFVGCGSGIYSELGNNNVLLESPETGESLLIDCGFVSAPKLEREGRLSAIKNALVTHVHSDHVGGFEYWAYLNRYVWNTRPNVFYHESVFDEFWSGTLRGGLLRSQDAEGRPEQLGLADYYTPRPLRDNEIIRIPGLPDIRLAPTLHVVEKPAYSLFIGDTIYFSSDTVELPPTHGPTGKPLEAIFQDCQLFEGPSNVHISIFQLDRGMAPDHKRITWLMHYGRGFEKHDPLGLGFAGFVSPGQTFTFQYDAVESKVR